MYGSNFGSKFDKYMGQFSFFPAAYPYTKKILITPGVISLLGEEKNEAISWLVPCFTTLSTDSNWYDLCNNQ